MVEMKAAKKKILIAAILDDFDFERVRAAMTAVNWNWFDSENPPSIKRMTATAKSLLRDVMTHDDVTASETGGFRASQYRDEDGARRYSLEFVLASAAR